MLLLLLLNKLQVKLPCWSPFVGKYVLDLLSPYLAVWLSGLVAVRQTVPNDYDGNDNNLQWF